MNQRVIFVVLSLARDSDSMSAGPSCLEHRAKQTQLQNRSSVRNVKYILSVTRNKLKGPEIKLGINNNNNTKNLILRPHHPFCARSVVVPASPFFHQLWLVLCVYSLIFWRSLLQLTEAEVKIWVFRRGSRISVRGAQWSFDPKGAETQNLLKAGVFPLNCLKAAWLKNLEGKGGPGLPGPPGSATGFVRIQNNTKTLHTRTRQSRGRSTVNGSGGCVCVVSVEFNYNHPA